MKLQNSAIQTAYQWLSLQNGENFLLPKQYCATRDTFLARLEKLMANLKSIIPTEDISYLIIAIIGELGNNSFDHNLGNWRDAPGIYFAFDKKEHIIITADRGQGIKKTISRIRRDIKTDADAIHIAFTEIISGRAPEQRGNGLKFVAKSIALQKLELFLHSGRGTAVIGPETAYGLRVNNATNEIFGTLAAIKF